MKDKYKFLTAPRFWALIIGALSIYAQTKGWIGEAEMQLIATISGLFITVGTVDRISDKVLEGKKVEAHIPTYPTSGTI